MDYVAYYRVSTQQQGRSGLGLEAQQYAIREYLNKGNHALIGEYTEVESGKSIKNRPMLQESLKACKKHKAILIIAKLDRLARNVHFISGLMESNIDFVALDNPNANRFMLHLIAAFAEHEREQISERTKAALQAAKQRGVILGKSCKLLNIKKKKDADEFAAKMHPILDEIMDRDIVTNRGIADELNRLGVPTFRANGSKWDCRRIFDLFKRLDNNVEKIVDAA